MTSVCVSLTFVLNNKQELWYGTKRAATRRLSAVHRAAVWTWRCWIQFLAHHRRRCRNILEQDIHPHLLWLTQPTINPGISSAALAALNFDWMMVVWPAYCGQKISTLSSIQVEVSEATQWLVRLLCVVEQHAYAAPFVTLKWPFKGHLSTVKGHDDL